MLERLIPWKFLVKHITRTYGLIDPFTFLAKLRRFSQPSDVQEPLELLRAGLVFHARGLINTRVIQNNLDWIWPFWVEKQFNPQDASFIPRAYSLTHINLTNRNWTAVGQPNLPVYPLVDPRGLVTPLFDGWSLDFWMFGNDGSVLLPSKLQELDQRFIDPDLTIQTQCTQKDLSLATQVHMTYRNDRPVLVIRAKGLSLQNPGRMVVSLRPYNPEGVQIIERIDYNSKTPAWIVDSETRIELSQPPERVFFSNYEKGDVFNQLSGEENTDHIVCQVGMASSALVFPLKKDQPSEIELTIFLENEVSRQLHDPPRPPQTWESVLQPTPKLTIPDKKIESLYHTAQKTLVLLSADEIYPGPYTYRRFWFRDACLMINALLSLGLKERCVRLLDKFFSRQKFSGYFESQEGEWDSNGQVLWIFYRFYQMAGKNAFKTEWLPHLFKAATWIKKKRLPKTEKPHSRLLPAGFSAEHFGPNDYYYWDDLWGLAGLKSAARLAGIFGFDKEQTLFNVEADDFHQVIFDSITNAANQNPSKSIPASPYRRMDSGAIGSLVADYPLQLTEPGNRLIKNTVDYLMEHCVYSGCFFQDMIHSGMNLYLTLDLAQSLLRMNDSRFQNLIEQTAHLASPTGQWPEAVHPFSGGGCMGDGQHGWAAAEWAQMINSLFVREEEDKLVLGSGIFPEWLQSGEELVFGPASVSYGSLTIRIFHEETQLFLKTHTQWHTPPPVIEIRVPGYIPEHIQAEDTTTRLTKE